MADRAVRESTIDTFIDDYRDQNFQFDTIFMKESDAFSPIAKETDTKDVILLEESILNKYRKDLAEHIIEKEFTPEEYRKYIYNPWRLSYDLYGNVEYWGILLDLNNMFSVSEFNQSSIKVYDEGFPQLIDSLLDLEDPHLTINRAEVNENNLRVVEEEDDE